MTQIQAVLRTRHQGGSPAGVAVSLPLFRVSEVPHEGDIVGVAIQKLGTVRHDHPHQAPPEFLKALSAGESPACFEEFRSVPSTEDDKGS